MKLFWTRSEERDKLTAEIEGVRVTGCGDTAWRYGGTYAFAPSVTVSASSVEAVRETGG